MTTVELNDTLPLVTLIDDDPLQLKLLIAVLSQAGLAVRSCSAREYLAGYDPGLYGCVVSDVRMPDMDGLELQHRLNLMGAIVPLILISGHADVRTAVEAVQRGAFDFLEKPIDNQLLVACVRRALDVDRICREQFVGVDLMLERFKSLDQDERDVLDLLADGSPDRSIALELHLDEQSVIDLRRSIMDKMGATSFAQLMHMVLEVERAGLQLQISDQQTKH
jgi:two-component system, LuxR family, response regulator FixJ